MQSSALDTSDDTVVSSYLNQLAEDARRLRPLCLSHCYLFYEECRDALHGRLATLDAEIDMLQREAQLAVTRLMALDLDPPVNKDGFLHLGSMMKGGYGS